MKTVLVLPTFNEAENIRKIIPAIFSQLPSAHILVIDDGSPDGTGKIAESLALSYPEQIRVFHRAKKSGLGRAYLYGFKQALEIGADCVIQMDSDFSHPPALLPELVSALNEHDFVLGSRYVKGGGTQNWGLLRRLISRGGNFYARTILHSPIRDLTGGFKAFHRRVIEYLLQCPLDSSGYCFQVETTSYALAAGFRCLELPFIFTDRQAGYSKMSKNIVLEALIKVWNLRGRLNRRQEWEFVEPLPKPKSLLEQL